MSDQPLGQAPVQTPEAQKLSAEINSLIAATRKANADAANAEAQNAELTRRRSFYERVLSTTQATILLALFTLSFQIAQFGFTSLQNRRADEAKQWKETIAGVSFDGGDKSVGAMLNLETFLDSSVYAQRAKSMIAVILPFVTANDAFDHTFDSLYHHSAWTDDDVYLYSVAKAVSVEYGNDTNALFHDPYLRNAAKGHFRRELSEVLAERVPLDDHALKEANRREYQIDTVTHALVDFWATHGTRPPGTDATYPLDLQSIILRYDDDGPVDLRGRDLTGAVLRRAYLHQADLTGNALIGANLMDADLGAALLTGAHLDDTNVKGANFDEVTAFENSTWRNVRWWEAEKISSELCAWLQIYGMKPPKSSPLPCIAVSRTP